MWQCQNCGYTDETGKTFEVEEGPEGEELRYCPECGSDEVFLMDEDEDAFDDDDEDEDDDEYYEDDDDDWNGEDYKDNGEDEDW